MSSLRSAMFGASALLVLTLFLPACGGGGASGPSKPAGHNVILITLDTTRADHLSCYGTGKALTPSLDRLAEAGARFDLALTSSAVTPVSHATILTGQFQYGHGLRVISADGGFRLPADQESLTTRMVEAGYRTGAVHSAFPVSGYFGFNQGFDVFESFDGSFQEKAGGDLGWDVKSLQRRSDQTTERALAFVGEGDGPFFLWIHYWDVHDGLMVPPTEWLSELAKDKRGKPSRDDLYVRELEYMDQQIGRLLDGLDQAGLADNTLIAVTSDHGEGLSDGKERHDWSRHRVVYQEQLRVPLLMRGPGIPAGLVIDPLVRTADIAPTLLDLAGLEPFEEAHGVTLRPYLDGGSPDARIAYADQVNAYDTNAAMVKRRPAAAFLHSVIEEPWKLIYRPHMPEASELFRLDQDPGEQSNLWSSEPEQRERLLIELAKRRPWVTSPFPPDAQANGSASSALNSLGYGGGEEDEGELEEDPSGEAPLTWVWSCPSHPSQQEPQWGRCEACAVPLIPRTTWR